MQVKEEISFSSLVLPKRALFAEEPGPTTVPLPKAPPAKPEAPPFKRPAPDREPSKPDQPDDDQFETCRQVSKTT